VAWYWDILVDGFLILLLLIDCGVGSEVAYNKTTEIDLENHQREIDTFWVS
jgi:hypothetical protein